LFAVSACSFPQTKTKEATAFSHPRTISGIIYATNIHDVSLLHRKLHDTKKDLYRL